MQCIYIGAFEQAVVRRQRVLECLFSLLFQLCNFTCVRLSVEASLYWFKATDQSHKFCRKGSCQYIIFYYCPVQFLRMFLITFYISIVTAVVSLTDFLVNRCMLLVLVLNSQKPLTIITKSSILDVATVLDPPLITLAL